MTSKSKLSLVIKISERTVNGDDDGDDDGDGDGDGDSDGDDSGGGGEAW